MQASVHWQNCKRRALLGLSLMLLSAGMSSCHQHETQKVSIPASGSAAASDSIPRSTVGSPTTGISPRFRVPLGYTTEQKPWKENPGSTVLLASGPSSAVVGTAFLGLLKDGVVVAFGTDKDENCDFAHDSLYSDGKEGTACEVVLDLAPYRIGDNEFAFGIRWKEDATFPAGENNAVKLRLWRVDAGKLKKILETSMEDSDEQRGPNDASEMKCTVSVSGEKTLDHFDLVKRCGGTSGPLVEDPEDRPAKVTKKISSRTLFRWNGSMYAEQKGFAGH